MTKTLKIVLIDDEEDVIEVLRLMIQEFCTGVIVVGTATSIEDGKKEIEETKPDLVFLDIEINNNTGFQLLDSLSNRDFQVAFVTAYDHYAIRAFKYAAMDYLLKPINVEELQETIRRAKSKELLIAQDVQTSDQLDTSEASIKNKKVDFLMIPHNGGHIKITINNLLYCEAKGCYTQFCLLDGSWYVLRKYEEVLSELNFSRCHKSFLVNLKYVKSINSNDLSGITLVDGSSIPLSVRKRKVFREEWESC
jgi:two-component system LytT family response regulator